MKLWSLKCSVTVPANGPGFFPSSFWEAGTVSCLFCAFSKWRTHRVVSHRSLGALLRAVLLARGQGRALLSLHITYTRLPFLHHFRLLCQQLWVGSMACPLCGHSPGHLPPPRSHWSGWGSSFLEVLPLWAFDWATRREKGGDPSTEAFRPRFHLWTCRCGKWVQEANWYVVQQAGAGSRTQSA